MAWCGDANAAVLLLLAFLLATGSCHSEPLECYTSMDGCTSVPDLGASSPRECCLGNGYWYRLDPSGECIQCIVHGFEQTELEASERTRLNVKVRPNLKGPHPKGILQLTVTAIPGTADSFDYNLRTTALQLISEVETVAVDILSDRVSMEGTETFQLRLEPVSPDSLSPNEFLRDTVRIKIHDENVFSVWLMEVDYAAQEGDGTLSVGVMRDTDTDLASEVVIHVTPLTFKDAEKKGVPIPPDLPAYLHASREDFNNSPPVEVVLSRRSKMVASVPIPIADDDISEHEQGFIVLLEVASAADPYLVDFSRRKSALCRIRDNDRLHIGFEMTEYTFDESDGVISDVVALVKNRPTEETVSVSVHVADPYGGTKSATLGKDFRLNPVDPEDRMLVFDFLPSQTKLYIPFEIIEDLTAEEPEAFRLDSTPDLSRKDSPKFDCATSEKCLTSTMITIIDNDKLIVGFEVTEVDVLEGVGKVDLCVGVLEPASEPFEVEFLLEVATHPGTAGDGDFISFSNLVLKEFSESVRSQCFSVTILDDNVPEDSEDFTVRLRGAFGEDNPSVEINPAEMTVRIRDNDDPTYMIGMEQAIYQTSEDYRGVSVCAALVSGTPLAPPRIRFTTEDGTAAASNDYHSLSEEVVLDLESRKRCVSIAIINDGVPELTEEFFVRLSVDDEYAILSIEKATVIIEDNDEPDPGCSVEVLILTATQERNRVALVEDVKTVLPSIFPDTGGPPPTTAEELFTTTYISLTEDLGRVKSDTGYTNFAEAVTEITEARQEACSGPPDERPSPEDIPGLAERFARLPLSEARELRKIFGEMLCIKNEVHSSRMKRQDPCAGVVCPSAGFDAVVDVCEFFACLDKDIEDRYGTRLAAVFGFVIDFDHFPCLAFVVDTTGSMGEEIRAVQNLIMAFVSSEQDEPACYIITPFNDYGAPPILGRDYGPATVYDTEFVSDLLNMRSDALRLTATGGGDCPEYGMNGMQETFRAKHPLYGIDAMTEGSQMILITDAFAKDASLAGAVIAEAHRRKVCIHLLLSTSGCGGDFSSYVKVATETGGTVVRGNSAELDTLIGVFGEFSTSYEDSPCDEFYRDRRRRKKNVPIPIFSRLMSERPCEVFRVSTFTDILKFLITTRQSQATVRKPNGETVNINIVGGYGAYREVGPQPGEWSVCVESGTLTVVFNNRVLLDFVVTFVKEDESSPGHLTATSVPPPACSTGEVAVVTSRVPDISLANLNFIRDGEVVGSIPLTPCGGAMIGNGTFPLGSVTYLLQGEDVGGNPFQISRKTVEFELGKYSLTSVSDSVEVDPGESTVFVFKLQNQNSYGSTKFTLTTELTSGVRAVLQQTHTSLKAAESAEISVRVIAGSSPGDNRVTIVASGGCTRVTASQTLSIKPPEVPTAPPDACGCENGGTCVAITRRGRVFHTCQCPPGFGGRRCEIKYVF